MRIAVISDYDHTGGAAIVARHLAERWGRTHTVQRFVGTPFAAEDCRSYAVTRGQGWLQRLGLGQTDMAGRLYARLRGRRLLDAVAAFQPDIVNVHDIHYYALPPSIVVSLAGLAPVAWTLHNMWSFTGGCANSMSCALYGSGCREPCPRKSRRPAAGVRDVAVRWRQVKATLAAFARLPVHGVTPSRWLHDCAALAGWSADRLRVIPNGVDPAVFVPGDARAAKRTLGIPEDRLCVMFSASAALDDPDKGFAYLDAALQRLEGQVPVYLLVVGHRAERREASRLVLGHTTNTTFLRACYAAADCFVLPSLAENAPLVLLEALSMGLPCVSFDVGGCPEIVREGQTGFVAAYKDADRLAEAIASVWRLGPAGRAAMGAECRRVAETEYAADVQAARYLDLFGAIGARPPSRARLEAK